MPRSAIENVDIDHIVPIAALGELLTRLIQEDVPEEVLPVSEDLDNETDIVELKKSALESENRLGKPAVFACPECGGTLWEVEEGDLIRFRCRVGHAYSAQTLLAHQEDGLEEAFWVALRALEESASLSHRMAERARSRGHASSAERFLEQEQDARAKAEIIRKMLLGKSQPSTFEVESDDADSENKFQTGTD
jgi:two-component system chemotaxis response regulator CheB